MTEHSALTFTDALSERAAAQAETIASLRRQLTELSTELAGAADAQMATTIERDGLARALKRRAEELADLHAELDSDEALLHEARARASSSEAARVALVEELSAAREAIGKLRGELAAAKREAASQEHELASRAARELAVRRRGAELERRLEQLESELGEGERESDERATRDATELTSLRWRIAAQERHGTGDRARLEQRITALVLEQQELRADLALVLEERRELTDERRELADQHRKLMDELEAANEITAVTRTERDALALERDAALEQARHGEERARQAEEEAHGREEDLHRQLREETDTALDLQAQLDRVERRLALRATQLKAIRGSRSFRVALGAANAKDALLHPVRWRRRRTAGGATDSEDE